MRIQTMISFDFIYFQFWFKFLVIFLVYYSLKLIIRKWLKTRQLSDRQKLTDQEDYPSFYPNGWLPVLESSVLKKSQILPIFAFGNDLVAFRSTAGKVTVLDAYCPHLGAHLGYGGRVINDTVNCPFHGWVFNESGECVHIPGNFGSTIPKAQVKVWDSLEINGFIFVWNNAKGDKPNWFPEKLDSDLSYRSKYETTVNTHIQVSSSF